MKTSIVIPAFNEEELIKETIIKIHKTFSGAEIIVVSDGSTDNTVNIARGLENKLSNLKVIELSRQGKGAAIIRGFEESNGEIIGFLDADDAFEIKKIKEIIQLLQIGKYDCVIASKWEGISFSQVEGTLIRKIASRTWNVLVRILFNLNINDTQAGAKFLRRHVLNKIGTKFYCKGFETDVELLARIVKNGFSIKEIYIPSSNRKESKFRMIKSIEMLLGIIKLKMNGL